MRKNLLVPLAVSLLFLGPATSGRMGNAYGQEKAGPQLPPHVSRPRGDPGVCADLPGQTSGTHRFRVGETIEIPLRGDGVPASVADCEPVELKLYWANGRNNGSMFNVTFLDDHNIPIYTRQIPGFLPGVLQFPLSSFDTQPGNGSSLAMISVPTTVTIQAVQPFAAPATLSYTVTRVARVSRPGERREEGNGVRDERETREKGEPESRKGNEIVSIHNAVRLIGASRLPVVQIELKTSRPFPVRDVPLQLRIGKRVFIDELSGEYTGRKLTLSLTPEMFAELKDGDEIVAFFSKPDGNEFAEEDVWHFGKLDKKQ
jgi:hypothetical protein